MICSLTPSGDRYLSENRLMNWFRKICLMLLLTWAALADADAHAFINHAEPPVGGKVKQMPSEVRIWFTEPIDPGFSNIKVLDAMGKRIDKKNVHTDAKNSALMEVSLASIPPGTYQVLWRVVSVDSHATEGDFTFQFLP